MEGETGAVPFIDSEGLLDSLILSEGSEEGLKDAESELAEEKLASSELLGTPFEMEELADVPSLALLVELMVGKLAVLLFDGGRMLSEAGTLLLCEAVSLGDPVEEAAAVSEALVVSDSLIVHEGV